MSNVCPHGINWMQPCGVCLHATIADLRAEIARLTADHETFKRLTVFIPVGDASYFQQVPEDVANEFHHMKSELAKLTAELRAATAESNQGVDRDLFGTVCTERDVAYEERDAALAENERMRGVLAWFAGDDCGVSSETIARRAMGLRESAFGPCAPSDRGDRGRCIRLLQRFPWMLDSLAELESQSDEWKIQGDLIRADLSPKGT